MPYQTHHHYFTQSSDEEDVVSGGSEGPRSSAAPEPSAHCTCGNSYGIYHIYPGGKASYSPDEIYSLDSVTDDPAAMAKDSDELLHPWWATAPSSDKKYYAPFQTASHFRLMRWFYDGSTSKTFSALDDLVQNILLASDFKREDLVGFRAAREAERLDKSGHTPSRFSADDNWIESSVQIFLPAEGVTGRHASENLAPKFTIPGLIHRRLLHVIKAALQETSTRNFHLFPYQEFWEPSPGSPPERMYSELYTSDAFLAEHDKIRAHCNRQDSGSETENVIVAITLWSDSTHLTSFGNASLWPIYVYVGNLSKYIRSKPTSNSAHHLAYIPKVSYLHFL